MNEDVRVTMKIIEVLDRLEIPYLIGGSLASSVHGISRATLDADLLVNFKTEHVEKFVEAVQEDFYVSSEAISNALSRYASFNLIDYSTGFKIDIFIPKNREFDRKQFTNRVFVVVGEPESMAFVASAEDTILAKLEWYKLGDQVSDCQWNDILGIIKIQGAKMDIQYMRDGAKELGVLDLLARALRQGLPELPI